MQDINEIIAKRQAAPKRYCVVTAYDNGTERTHYTETKSQAENWAIGERRKLGHSFQDRESGEILTRVSVTIDAV